MGFIISIGIIFLAIIACLIQEIKYKNHCIEDGEYAMKRQRTEFVKILYELKEYQNFEPVGKDTYTRRCIDNALHRYDASGQIKKELNINSAKGNV